MEESSSTYQNYNQIKFEKKNRIKNFAIELNGKKMAACSTLSLILQILKVSLLEILATTNKMPKTKVKISYTEKSSIKEITEM